MSRRYNVDELLRLRNSPLIHKPDNLSPVEEWMGAQEPSQRKAGPGRGHTEESTLSNKRPGLADFHHISRRSSTAPEDIVLGPPKTAFSSASARAAKQTALDIAEEPTGNKDRSSFPERQARDKEGGDKDSERREGRQNGVHTRRVGREDREEWQNGRQRRNYDQEDGDQKSRRVGDRERDRTRWDPKQGKDGLDSEGDGDGRLAGRRDGQGRARFEQPWFRGEKPQDGEQKTSRNEWRRDRATPRGDDWDKDRFAKAEQDPEWMDSTEMDEPNQKHTQEDFQKWKERMKAGGTPAEDKPDAIEEKQQGAAPKIEPLRPDVLSKPALKSTPEIDAAMDKFFANFNEKSAETKAAEVKAPRKGRFAAFFSPPPPEEPATSAATAPIEPEEPKNAAPHTPGMNDADQAGFQRILQMLGQRSNNATPQDQSQQRSKPQSTAREHQREIPTQARSPENNGRLTETTSRDSPPQNRQPTGLENVLGPQSPTREHGPRPQSTSSKDTELLLRLMQQPSYNQNPLPQPQPGSALLSGMRQTPGILQMPDNRNRLPKPQGEKLMQLPLLEKPAGLDSARNEQQAPREVLQRRPTNGHAPSFFDEPFFNELRQTGQQQEVNANQLRNQGVPIAMQRPPGFDQAPQAPPGWPSLHPMQVQHQHQLQQGPIVAPPGIPNPQHRGMNPSFPPTQQMPRQMTMGMPPPFQIAPAQRQRKYTGDGGAGFPPGMGPPGFMTNGPPPGFPALPHGLGTAGAQLDTGGGMSSRHLMDLYARSGGRGGPSGGGGGGNMLGGYQ